MVSQAVEFSRGGPVEALRQLAQAVALAGEQGLLRVPEPRPGVVGGANPQGQMARMRNGGGRSMVGAGISIHDVDQTFGRDPTFRPYFRRNGEGRASHPGSSTATGPGWLGCAMSGDIWQQAADGISDPST